MKGNLVAMNEDKKRCPNCGALMRLQEKTTSVERDSYFCESCRIWFSYPVATDAAGQSTLTTFAFSLR